LEVGGYGRGVNIAETGDSVYTTAMRMAELYYGWLVVNKRVLVRKFGRMRRTEAAPSGLSESHRLDVVF
jgi:hypothetical protein